MNISILIEGEHVLFYVLHGSEPYVLSVGHQSEYDKLDELAKKELDIAIKSGMFS